MANPFEKRATEYLRDDEAFLAVVTPEPLVTFLQTYAREERLYDRLAMNHRYARQRQDHARATLRVQNAEDSAAQ